MRANFLFMLLAASVILTSISACKKEEKEVSSGFENQDIESAASSDASLASDSAEPKEYLLPGPITVDYKIRYYDVIDDKIIEYTDSTYFEESAEPEFFINKLASLMQMKIDVNSIVVSNDKMIIDFSSASAPLNGTGSYEESCILESIAEVMLSVYDNINYIYYTADGKDYESGHISLSIESPYAQR